MESSLLSSPKMPSHRNSGVLAPRLEMTTNKSRLPSDLIELNLRVRLRLLEHKPLSTEVAHTKSFLTPPETSFPEASLHRKGQYCHRYWRDETGHLY
ncbi:conserved hypothetical protein [Ricinus communis]|uniref:Uncharacterized protein n=1 Tax=Ricinus communis TaxID=3988 RepID=B9SWV1_RICCO|nr:conserved hypothetical protein [Ricinus communis]